MQQLALLNEPTEITTQDAYAQLAKGKVNWYDMIECASIIERSFRTDNYKELGFDKPAQFFDSLPDSNTYIQAAKTAWWFKLVFTELPKDFFTQEDVKINKFLQTFRIVRYDRNYKRICPVKPQIPVAQAHYKIAKQQTTKLTPKVLDLHAETYSTYQTNEMIQGLQSKIAELTGKLEKAYRGLKEIHGYDASNWDIPDRYIELYSMAKRTNMSSIQHAVFVDILMFKGYYPACQYLDKFDPDYFDF